MKSGFLELPEADLRAHTLWLRRLAAQLVHGASHAEDAVQDTLVAALRRPPALDRDVRPWLARVLANFTRSGHRSEVRRRRRETEVATDQGQAGESAPGADELLERHEAARVVAGLVSGLGEPHRGLVLLRFAEGLTPKEIARRQGVPEGTVRRQFKEALDQLRAAVAAHYDRDARDWRLSLVPLVRADGGNEALAGALKGIASMAVKSKMKVALGLGLAALLALVATGWRWWPDDPDGDSATAAKDSEAKVQRRSSSSSASSASPPGGEPGPPGSPGAAPAPPTFTVRAEADWPGCQDQLTTLRAQASGRALLSPAAFESAPPSPRTEREVTPIVAAVMARLPGEPSYQLECRPSLCRIGSVTDPADRAQPRPGCAGWGRTRHSRRCGGTPGARASNRSPRATP
jgi:RNA polymerase sigma factor (sigma-70 family)